jgi:hypothetical protein
MNTLGFFPLLIWSDGRIYFNSSSINFNWLVCWRAGEFYVTVVGPLADGEGVKAKDWGKVSAAMRETLKPSLETVLQHLKQEIEPKIREVLKSRNQATAGLDSGA